MSSSILVELGWLLMLSAAADVLFLLCVVSKFCLARWLSEVASLNFQGGGSHCSMNFFLFDIFIFEVFVVFVASSSQEGSCDKILKTILLVHSCG
jgi:hypothetical protein